MWLVYVLSSSFYCSLNSGLSRWTLFVCSIKKLASVIIYKFCELFYDSSKNLSKFTLDKRIGWDSVILLRLVTKIYSGVHLLSALCNSRRFSIGMMTKRNLESYHSLTRSMILRASLRTSDTGSYLMVSSQSDSAFPRSSTIGGLDFFAPILII